MASTASVYVDILPVTGKIADGIAKALREVDDVRAAAKRWRQDIDVNFGKPEVEVTVDTRPAERKIDELEPDRDRALEPAVRPGDTPVVRRPGDHQQRAGRRGSGTYWQPAQSLWTPIPAAWMCNGRRTPPPTASARTWCSPAVKAVTTQAFSARWVS